MAGRTPFARSMVDDDEDVIGDDEHSFAPHHVSGDAGASDDELEQIAAPLHRDSHATFVFAPVPHEADALWLERPGGKPDFSALLQSASAKSALDRRTAFIPFAKTAPSPQATDVPLKEPSVFSNADHSFTCTGGHSPAAIMHTLKQALAYLDAVDVRESASDWRLDVSCLCVAEQIDFVVRLTRLSDDSLEVAFHHTFGDEMRFLLLMECVRARCRAIDDDALSFLDDTLEPWMDARQDLSPHTAATSPADALALVRLLHADVHGDTLFEVAKELKNHCRHASSRVTFHRVDPKHFLAGLKGLLASPSLDLSRFGAFILLQFATDDGARSRLSPFFHSPYEKSAFGALLTDVIAKHESVVCGAFTVDMVRTVQRSWLFA